MISEPLCVALQMAEIFENLDIPYLVGGSIASSIYGEPRATQDIDMVAELKNHHIQALIANTKNAFYIEEEDVIRAVSQHSSFNVIHLETMIKVDIFVLGSEAIDREEMRRRRPQTIADTQLVVATPEDIVLQKLIWYRKGGEVSDRQLRDVSGILKVQGDRLDWDYLKHWAESLNLSELLQRAREESEQHND
ncbi:MAG: hypothetical protein OXI23_08470 [Gemmatimonadota bacterium]|nr:hypothetical protein [Gemmatimonadota bacterium]